ncbi:hypothetical protein Pelo_15777 [Pelomyxa schiedti]|nr:hypothetical protein Pelo_15777 [Pelomyxa schiedti]
MSALQVSADQFPEPLRCDGPPFETLSHNEMQEPEEIARYASEQLVIVEAAITACGLTEELLRAREELMETAKMAAQLSALIVAGSHNPQPPHRDGGSAGTKNGGNEEEPGECVNFGDRGRDNGSGDVGSNSSEVIDLTGDTENLCEGGSVSNDMFAKGFAEFTGLKNDGDDCHRAPCCSTVGVKFIFGSVLDPERPVACCVNNDSREGEGDCYDSNWATDDDKCCTAENFPPFGEKIATEESVCKNSTSCKQTFAGWEKYTRGVGSKLMLKMGYIMGTGLGASQKGRITPVPVTIVRKENAMVGLGHKKRDPTSQKRTPKKKSTPTDPTVFHLMNRLFDTGSTAQRPGATQPPTPPYESPHPRPPATKKRRSWF